jgi:hypothetical protein
MDNVPMEKYRWKNTDGKCTDGKSTDGQSHGRNGRADPLSIISRNLIRNLRRNKLAPAASRVVCLNRITTMQVDSRNLELSR